MEKQEQLGISSRSPWTIRDPEGHVYKVPRFTLKPGKTVRLHTGKGKNPKTDLVVPARTSAMTRAAAQLTSRPHT